MFNKDAVVNPPEKVAEPPLSVETMSVGQLLELRARVQARLPMKLSDLDLEAELMLQYTQGKLLLNLVSTDEDTPANQKAQVQNSCAATLEQLVKLQTRLYDAERMKRIEQALIKAVKAHLPLEGQEQFFAAYEKIYNETGEKRA
jgi:hypothetical protein